MRHAAFLAAGLLATTAQVLLLRELVVDAAGDEAAIGVGLAAWLVGIALGAVAARRRRPLAAPGDAAAGLLALALLPPLAILGGRILRLALAPEAGELPGLGHVLAFSLATLAPPGLAVGWTFTALAASASRLWEAGEGITRLYVVESLGSLLGGVAVTVLAGAWLAPLRLAALVGALAALLALAAWRGGVLGRPWRLGAALAASAGLLAASPWLDAASQGARFAGIAPGLPLSAVAETPYQHLALGGSDVLHLYASGQYVASFPDPYTAESLGHLLALLAPRPRQVLMIGGTERGLLPVLLRHPVEKLVLVEPDQAAFEFLVPRLPGADRAALGDPRVVTVHADPRGFLASPVGGPYDLVLLLSGEPATLLRARLATVEFFAAVASRLGPEGALVLPVRTAPLAITGETASLAGSLFRSLRLVLPVVRATPGPDTLLVAGGSAEAVTLDPTLLAVRWRERRISSSFDPAILPVLLASDRVAAQEAALQSAEASAEASRDDRPISFLHALARRQQTTAGAWGRVLSAASRTPPGLLVALAFLPSLAFLGRILVGGPEPRRAAAAASHAVGVVGAAGMGWWLLVLFSFQTCAGALYGQLGALTAAFMLGLALGATLAPRAAFARDERDAESLPGAVRALRLSVGAAGLFALALPFALPAAGRAAADGVGWALVGHGALLLAAGAATGGAFPAAADVRLAAGDGPGDAAGRLEAADHVGAAAAALFGAVLFVPLLGLTGTVWLLAGLVVVALAGTVVR